MIRIKNKDGKTIKVPKDNIQFRPSVYAIVIEKNNILLGKSAYTNKYTFPGGGVKIGEKLIDALKREIKEELNAKIYRLKYYDFAESMFYYEPNDKAYQCYRFFYKCTISKNNIDVKNDDDFMSPRWIRIKDIKINNVQNDDQGIMKKICAEQAGGANS